MAKITDWKFLIMFFAALAGAMVPVWLWQADQTSRSLNFEIVSQTSLQPADANAISGLKLSVDGVNLEAPYLSVVELANNGSKPVPTSDYESPIELRVQSGVVLVRARVTAMRPQNLGATLFVDKDGLKIKPLLLNPGDSITIAAITSGPIPVFEARARIAGIPSVQVEAQSDKAKPLAHVTLLLIGFLLYVVSSVVPVMELTRRVYKGAPSLRMRTQFFIFFVTISVAAIFVDYVVDARGYGFWVAMAANMAIGSVSLAVAYILNRPLRASRSVDFDRVPKPSD